ncbi:MAG TPA: hypothetical protein VMF05_05005 [Stellaceae bacterium]|nr:hypothetical protein [Stellaceae bacterium]
MAAGLVVGLFQSSGIALDAYHRLCTEGVSPSRLAYHVLREIGPPPEVLQPELQALQIDPMVLGDARHTFARFIHNGETAVFVEAADDAEAAFAADILKLYTPVAVEIMPPPRPAGTATAAAAAQVPRS